MRTQVWATVKSTQAFRAAMRSATSCRKRGVPSGSRNTQWMTVSIPASTASLTPWVEEQCAAVGLPNLCASSTMARSSLGGVGRTRGVRRAGAAAGGDDLDEVGALFTSCRTAWRPASTPSASWPKYHRWRR